MPTGYTADVKDGKITEFRDFALQCARAFGACIEMRDDPLSTPIPDEFKADNYHANRVVETMAELKRVESMSSVDVAAECEREYEEAAKRHRESVERTTETRNHYNAMLAKVVEWEPPSPAHVELKQFMIQQLTESRQFDCIESDPPKREAPADWRQRKMRRLTADLEYHATGDREEHERAASRTLWVRQLRESLA